MLLDEPSFGLAPLLVRELFAILRDNRGEQGQHAARRAERRAWRSSSRTGLPDRDRPRRAFWQPQNLKSDDAVRRSYLGY